MKIKIITALMILFLSGSVTLSALTMDDYRNLIFVKMGVSYGKTSIGRGYTQGEYVEPAYSWSARNNGYSLSGEYLMRLNAYFLGAGLEYIYDVLKLDGSVGGQSVAYDTHANHFIRPSVSVKYVLYENLFAGAGLSARYMLLSGTFGNSLPTTSGDQFSWERSADIWIDISLGYLLLLKDFPPLIAELRAGRNLTNSQYQKMLVKDYKDLSLNQKSAYDIGLYAGFCFILKG